MPSTFPVMTPSGKRSKKLNCPFSLVFKKQEIMPGNDNKIVHPVVQSNPQAADVLSQTGGIGIYYLCKFRGLHNHPLEWSLMDYRNKGGLWDEPERFTERGEVYTEGELRYHLERTTVTFYET